MFVTFKLETPEEYTRRMALEAIAKLDAYEPDWRDSEQPWSDSMTEIERQNSIKGR